MKTEAWRALSYGSRALYMALKCRYNTKLQGSVYLSTRDAVQELSLHQHRTNIMKWYRELQYYGFIVIVSLPHYGLNGHGKAAHWRLTEEWYLGKPPTRDFLNWDGVLFQEQKSPKHYQQKNRSRGTYGRTTVVRTGIPLPDQSKSEMPESGTYGHTISEDSTGTHGSTITSLTTPCAASEPASGFMLPPGVTADAIPTWVLMLPPDMAAMATVAWFYGSVPEMSAAA